jgi:DNA-binding beta-propeller fold protein YncE
MKEPVGLAINDAAGEIYVASTWSKKIVVFSLQGRFLRDWTLRAWAATSESRDTGNRPYLALDKTGRYLFVTDPDVGRVLVYDNIGTAVVSFGTLGTLPYTNSTFGVLGGIVTDPTTSHVYVVDSGGGRIVRFDPAVLPGLMLPQQPDVSPNNNTGSAQATAEVTAEAAQPTAEATMEATPAQ